MKRTTRNERSLARLAIWLTTACLVALPSMASSWVSVFGGEEDDIGWAIKATPDGGYVVAGETSSYGAGKRDALLLKLDGQGALQWSKTLGGTLDDAAFDVCVTADGGYAFTGISYNFNTAPGGGWATPWLLRLDSSGHVLWEKYYVRQAASWTYGISQTRDGGFVLAGVWRDLPFLLKVDSEGSLQWQRAYGGTVVEWSALTRVVETPDGGFAAAGWYWGGDYQHSFVELLIKVDSGGNLLWQKQFQDPNDYHVDPTTSEVTNAPDGNLVFVGGDPAMAWKLDQQGNVLWTQRVTNQPGGGDVIDITEILPAPEGSYYAVGQEELINNCYPNPPCVRGTLLVKLSEDGALEWEKAYQADFRTPYATGFCLAADGGLAVVGATHGDISGSDVVVLRVDPEGSFSDPCVAILDPAFSWSAEPTEVQDATALPVDAPCSALPGAIPPASVSMASSDTICPVIRSVTVLQNPFRLDIKGFGFVADSWVEINGISVPALNRKYGYEFIAKKGSALKAMVPKGQAVCVTVNGDWGTYKSNCFMFTR